MQILFDHKQDVRSRKFRPGAYEWWYFDGVDNEGVYSFVVIFYEGNPFSTRYIRRLQNRNRTDNLYAEEHPAVSISIYENRKPVYYSFSEFDKQNCFFDDLSPRLKVGGHTMESDLGPDRIRYRLNLEEELPSGDRLHGIITFDGPVTDPARPEGEQSFEEEGHLWNLVQPRSTFQAELTVSTRIDSERSISFEGMGYHDHNKGLEPMRNEFNEWYWGRFHFEMGTLVYYLMDQAETEQQGAWLIGPQNGRILDRYEDIELLDFGWNKFGMRSARKIMLSNERTHITVQQTGILDDGPFYQRFSSDSFINIPERDIMQVSGGISEYIRPDRIYWRIFWPFLNMRIRYTGETPHWVQRSKRLYRWTW